ncbi:Uncharacterised protein [Vibrio cholerae]|nr:Uncharacterised protein [Vibrio cholerae]CSA60518.1 Uncharacterised protein [Vibrio cholerae]CSB08058.1 Uncharacterised protein [Vibrio cholerae]CSC01159.1 Uncharacterised protein [Vibrio cholerae]CSC18583.1 Uncharacterised protein [Vibrio cholerae]
MALSQFDRTDRTFSQTQFVCESTNDVFHLNALVTANLQLVSIPIVVFLIAATEFTTSRTITIAAVITTLTTT